MRARSQELRGNDLTSWGTAPLYPRSLVAVTGSLSSPAILKPTGLGALTWVWHPHPLLTGAGSPFTRRPGSSVAVQAVLWVYLFLVLSSRYLAFLVWTWTWHVTLLLSDDDCPVDRTFFWHHTFSSCPVQELWDCSFSVRSLPSLRCGHPWLLACSLLWKSLPLAAPWQLAQAFSGPELSTTEPGPQTKPGLSPHSLLVAMCHKTWPHGHPAVPISTPNPTGSCD